MLDAMELSFAKFMELVDATDDRQIDGMTSTHRRVAESQPADPEAAKILAFVRFLASCIAPNTDSIQDRDFYRRTTERLVQARVFPQDAMDQFAEWPPEFQ